MHSDKFPTMRSLLYVPATSERMILKALETKADGLIIDLEDSVAPEQKLAARETLVRLLKDLNFGDKEVFVRINGIATEWGLDDARAATASGAPGIVIPKMESPHQVTDITPVLHNRDWVTGGIHHSRVMCLIETPRGVLAAREIAEAHESIVGLIFGSADLSRSIGCMPGEDEEELFFARSQVLISARAAGVAAYDSPHFVIQDLDGLRRRSQAIKRLGYDGRTLIHPSHIDIVNEIFTPGEEQISEARRVVEAVEAALTEGRGVALLDGRMIDQVHLAAARKLLEHAGENNRMIERSGI